MTITCIAAWALVLLLLPLHLMLWASESRGQRIRRWRANGITWAECGRRLACSPTTAKRWATA